MDQRAFDPAEAVDVTAELGEDRPGENRLYRLASGDIVKVKAFWSTRPTLPGQREAEITASLCDAAGQALRNAEGQVEISETVYLIPSVGPVSMDDQLDEGRRRWAVAFHARTHFLRAEPAGVARRPTPPPAT